MGKIRTAGQSRAKENDIPRASGAHLRGASHSHRFVVGSGSHLVYGHPRIYRRGPDVCGSEQYLRHGNVADESSVEQRTEQLRDRRRMLFAGFVLSRILIHKGALE